MADKNNAPTREPLIVIASNRGPYAFRKKKDGTFATRRGEGGLVTALAALAERYDVLWIAAALSREDQEWAKQQGDQVTELGDMRLRLISPNPRRYRLYYNVIANPLLWFIQHQLWDSPRQPVITRATWDAWKQGYAAINRQFADAIADSLPETDRPIIIFPQDYHLYLVPYYLRQRLGDQVQIQPFLHIPWPGPDAWRVLPPPWRERVLHGLLGNDVVAFHTEGFARNFLLSAQELLGLPVDLEAMTVRVGDRTVAARHYPISIDVAAIRELAASPEVAEHAAALAETFGGDDRQLILRVDRTDPSKNIVRGFEAFGTLLDDHPDLAGRVSFLALLQPSRQDVPEYADYLAEIGATVARINAAHGGEGWEPVDLRLGDDLALAVAAYSVCDVLMVNALADGMNLVAKESVVVNRRDGVLALSENTGAHQELGAFAVTLYPFDIQQQADALHAALTMDRALRRARREAAARVVEENDINKWLTSQLSDLGVQPGQAG